MLIQMIENEILDSGEEVKFDDIAGLDDVKSTVNELVIMPMFRPEIFTGLRTVSNGLLLFGPPGTGMVLLISYQSLAHSFLPKQLSLTMTQGKL